MLCTELCAVTAHVRAPRFLVSAAPSLPVSSLTQQGCRAPSRNLSEEKINQKTYYDIEKRGELLAAPDRADEWGEELTEMGKWQRTNVRPPPVLHTILFPMYFISVYEVAAPKCALPLRVCARFARMGAARAKGNEARNFHFQRSLNTACTTLAHFRSTGSILRAGCGWSASPCRFLQLFRAWKRKWPLSTCVDSQVVSY